MQRSSPRIESRQCASERKERNIGLELLRAGMSFMVVLSHFWSNKDGGGVLLRLPIMIHNKFGGCAVPVFMLMSFFLVEHTLQSGSSSKLRKRFERLLVPYIAWPVIYFAIYLAADAVRIIENTSTIEWVKQLGWQLLLGSSPRLDAVLWFHADMILFTLFFAVLLRAVKHNTSALVALIAIAALVMQYSGVNYKLFGALPYEARWTLGRMCEVLPCACAGVLLARQECFKRLHGLGSAAVCAAALWFVAKFNVFSGAGEGFYYQGMALYARSLLLFALFYLSPLDKLPAAIKKAISFLARYSMGVYCIHMLVGRATTAGAQRLLVDRIGGGRHLPFVRRYMRQASCFVTSSRYCPARCARAS